MSKFKKQKSGDVPAVNTASLPDIVFMLLFFFMVAAAIKPSDYQKFIELKPAKAAAMTDIVKKDMISYMYLGVPKDKNRYPQDFLLLLNDKPAEIKDIRGWIGDETNKHSGEELLKYPIVTQITVDKRAKVGYVQAVKEQLSQAKAFNVSYAGVKGDPEK